MRLHSALCRLLAFTDPLPARIHLAGMRTTRTRPLARLCALLIAGSLLFAACKGNDSTVRSDDDPGVENPDAPAAPAVSVPAFNADSAYEYVAAQVAFGSRAPGSGAQKACARWLQEQLAIHCDTVHRQETTVQGGDGKSLRCINLIGAVHPQATRRILLLAHWDSRPWADMDTARKDEAIDGADDGASGVGVLLEVARQMKTSPIPPSLGVDFLFVDVEDYGKTEWGDDSYGLGTQHWARNMHVPGYRAEWGLLLDMVGGRGARFPKEQTSRQYAPDVQDRIYRAAQTAGYADWFPLSIGGGTTDDHTFVNEIARIPTVDVIHLTSNTASQFPPWWHTHADNMDVIDRSTLKAVGQTVLQALYDAAVPPTP